jgi:hypothetical protein
MNHSDAYERVRHPPTCEERFQECRNKAKRQALKGGLIVFVASSIAFDTATVGCIGTGLATLPCILAVEELQTAVTPILLAPFGGNYFGNVADCSDQEAKCLAHMCNK